MGHLGLGVGFGHLLEGGFPIAYYRTELDDDVNDDGVRNNFDQEEEKQRQERERGGLDKRRQTVGCK